MATSDQYQDIINDFITERRSKTSVQVVSLDVWHAPFISKEQFWEMLQASTQAIMAERGVHRSFDVDNFNREIVLQMYLYVKGDPECKWNIHKGIYLGGKVGCGKTLLMLALTDILQTVSGYVIEMVAASQLYKKIQERGIDALARVPLFIDELGREQLEINDFGNRIRPINDLMAARYEYGSRTFFTSNFKLETLSKGRGEDGQVVGYGKYIGERIQEMTNIVNLPGDSRREKWETNL